jgi:benzodiazapine receptor
MTVRGAGRPRHALAASMLGYQPLMRVPTWVKTGAAVLATALLGSLATQPDSRWYRSLDKPAWQPPRQVFPFVWAVLYGLLAYAGARAMDATPGDKRRAFQVSYAANLGLNAGWTPIFFAFHRPGAALAEIIALDASNVDLLRRAWAADRVAGASLVPYLTWTALATALNADIVRRNR